MRSFTRFHLGVCVLLCSVFSASNPIWAQTATIAVEINANAPFCAAAQDLQLEAVGSTAHFWQWSGPNGFSSNLRTPVIIEPQANATGLYTVVASDSAGNSATATKWIDIYPSPNAQVAANLFLCPSQSGAFQASGGVQYQWWPQQGLSNAAIANPVAAPANTTTYSVTVSGANGCTAAASAVAFVYGAEAMTCNDLVNVSLDADGIVPLTGDLVLEGDHEPAGFYSVEVFGNQGQPLGGSLTCAMLNQTLLYKATDQCSGQYCTGMVKIEDKLAPTVTCANLVLPCVVTNLNPDFLSGLFSPPLANLYPVASDNCGPVTLSFKDNFLNLPCAAAANGDDLTSAVIFRTWTATDPSNNKKSCQQNITLVRPTLENLGMPDPLVTLSCSNPQTSPAITGTPYISFLGQRFPVFPEVGNCEFTINYQDHLLPICAGEYKIQRTWVALDDCLPSGPSNPRFFTQIIKIEDNSGPEIACPADLTVTTDPFNCCATVDLPDFIVSDNCSAVEQVSAMLQTFDPQSGSPLNMYQLNGALADFPGNNYWHPDTLAVFGFSPCLPIGVHRVSFTASDRCGRTSSCSMQLTVDDHIPPQPVCTQVTKVAIGAEGMTLVPAAAFDQGSTDNCQQVRFKARRMITACQSSKYYYDAVKFCCEDIGDTVMVELRVYDVAMPPDSIYLDTELENSNACMIQVIVEDKLKPVCIAPANVTVNCEAFDPGLSTYGTPQVADNCCLDTVTVTLNNSQFDTVCNRGALTRTFHVSDCYGNTTTCSQRVVVEYRQEYYLRFPDDRNISVCDGSGNYGEPTFFGENCELLGFSYKDQLFTVVPDACYTLERTWKVINWCTYDPSKPCIFVPNPTPSPQALNPSNLRAPVISGPNATGIWAPTVINLLPGEPQINFSQFWQQDANCYEYTQIIKIIDTQAPVISNCPAEPVKLCDLSNNDAQLWNSMDWWDNIHLLHDLCEGPADLSITARDLCSDTILRFHYLLFLDTDNNGIMETVVNSDNPPPPGIVQFNNYLAPGFAGGTPKQFDHRNVADAQRYRFGLQTTISGNTVTADLRWYSGANPVVPQLPVGTHKIKWLVEDGCGNAKICEYVFTVEDCKKPTVVCTNGLSVNIMPGGMITLWASDFLQYTTDNCTPDNQLLLAIEKSVESADEFPVDMMSGVVQTSVTFDCSNLSEQQLVRLWSRDKAGNADYCETYVLVQDQNSVCPDSAKHILRGHLKTEDNRGVDQVKVLFNPDTALPFAYDESDMDGFYQFKPPTLLVGSTVTLLPFKDDNHINGVSTFDLVLLSKHILGIEPLQSPYKMIAADANKSGSITTFDIVELRKLILGIYTELPGNTSWRFVDKKFSFPQPSNPFASVFPEKIETPAVLGLSDSLDFVAIKIGDLNGNVVPNNLLEVEERFAGNTTLQWNANSANVLVGDEITLHFQSNEAWLGAQFSLDFSGLTLLEVSGMPSDYYVARGTQLSCSWTAAQGQSETLRFDMRFRAQRSGALSELLQFKNGSLQPEAYLAQGRLALHLATGKADKALATQMPFTVYQNQPNPVADQTVIGFYLPEAGSVTLTVFDESGRCLLRRDQSFGVGLQQFTLDVARHLPAQNGLYYYRIESSSGTETRKFQVVQPSR